MEVTDKNINKPERQKTGAGQTYLLIYNIVYSLLFIGVNLTLCTKFLTGKLNNDFVLSLAIVVKWMTYFQYIEVIHPILGLTPGGFMMPFLQTFGRSLNITFLCNPIILQNAGVFGPWLLFVWSAVECIRYPFYVLKIFNIDIYPITWLRYTIFMPLYPAGGLCEFMVFRSAIQEYERTGAMSYQLPNALNLSLALPTFLKIHIYLVLGPAIFKLMKHMSAQRVKVLAPAREKET